MMDYVEIAKEGGLSGEALEYLKDNLEFNQLAI